MSIVNLVATLLAAGLLWLGCKQFRLSLTREQAQTGSTAVEAHHAAEDTVNAAHAGDAVPLVRQ